MHYTFYPKGVCSSKIDVDVENGVIHKLHYTDGCSGNLQAVSKLCEGRTVDEVIDTLSGIHCGFKPTSCADQLARALTKQFK